MPYSTGYDWAADQSMGAYLFKRYVRDNLLHLYYTATPTRHLLFHDESLVTAGNAIARLVPNTAYSFNYASRQNVAADGDTFTQSVVLTPGIYWMTAMGRRDDDCGKLTLTIGDHEYLTQTDLYTFGQDNNTTLFNLSFTIDEAARYKITGTIDGKRAASSGYYLYASYFLITPHILGEGDY